MLDQIKALVQSAIGFDQTRGDQITVANLQFAQRWPDPVRPSAPAGPGLFDFTRDDLINGAEMLVTLIIALALVFFVMRPLLKRVLSPEKQPLALPASAEINAAPPGMAMTTMPQLSRRTRPSSSNSRRRCRSRAGSRTRARRAPRRRRP